MVLITDRKENSTTLFLGRRACVCVCVCVCVSECGCIVNHKKWERVRGAQGTGELEANWPASDAWYGLQFIALFTSGQEFLSGTLEEVCVG